MSSDARGGTEANPVFVTRTAAVPKLVAVSGPSAGRAFRFARSVLAGIHLPAKRMIDHIRKDVADFTERKFLDDDGTLFIVKAL